MSKAAQSTLPVFLSPWMKRRAGILLHVCKCIEARVQGGKCVEPATVYFSARWHGRDLGGGHQLRLSANRLKSLFYGWRRNGVSAFVLGYGLVRLTHVTPRLRKRFLQLCCKPGATSFAMAYRCLSKPDRRAASYCSFHRALTRAQRVVFGRVFRVRRAGIASERELRALMEATK